jgi:hypothetical protein
MMTKSAAELAKEALKASAQVDPAERFDRLVADGLIDRKGRVTTLYGGTASPQTKSK